jgi:hypothetical protein
MKRLSFLPVPLWLVLCALVPVARVESAQAGEPLKVQVQLVWATDDPQSPDPKHLLLTGNLAKKLRNTYRWTNYFEVKKREVSIPVGGTNTVPMSEKCKLEIVSLKGDWVEVKLFGQGKEVVKHREKVAVDWPLIFAGNSSNRTAWFVVLKKLDPHAEKAKVKPKSDPLETAPPK